MFFSLLLRSLVCNEFYIFRSPFIRIIYFKYRTTSVEYIQEYILSTLLLQILVWLYSKHHVKIEFSGINPLTAANVRSVVYNIE